MTSLRCFEAVARLGRVTLAATELHVTHSAVSQQIRLLEDMMGVPLFIREGRGLRLTEEGRLYALDIRAALRSIAQATQLAQARPQETGLTIATLPSFALHWLMPRLPRFLSRHPHYRIGLQTGLEIQDLRHGLADVGIRMGQGHWPGLAQKALFQDRLVTVAAPDFRNGRLPATAAEVVQCPLIRSTDAPWDDWCAAASVLAPAAAFVLTANDSNIVIAAALRGQGIALERHSIVADALARGELVAVTDITVPYPYAYWLVWAEHETPKAGQTHFIAWITEEVAAYLATRSLHAIGARTAS